MIAEETIVATEQRDDSRRTHFINMTLAVLADCGNSGTTLARIANRANVSPALLVHYFGDKDSLLGAAFQHLVNQFQHDATQALKSAPTWRARIAAIVGCCLDSSQFRKDVGSVWLAFWGQAIHVPAIMEVQRIYQEQLLSNLSNALRPVLSEEQILPVATTIGALIDGIWLRAALQGVDEADTQAVVEQIGNFVDSCIAGRQAQKLSLPAIQQAIPDTCKSWIDGRPFASTGARFTTLNPATGEILAHVESATAHELDAAIESAGRGQKIWAAMSGTERGRILRRAADLLRENSRLLAHLETLDTGKPIAETQAVDIHSGADALEYYGSLAATINGEAMDLGSDAFGYTRREPLGITAGIGAWNYPLQIACWKSAPALACGNAMIFKPSELTPLTALRLAEIYRQAGLPDGVFNVLAGGRETGELLATAPAIRKVSLTGSVGTGRQVMASAAQSLKYVTLELGGKSPLIIFDDADIGNAVSAALLANFYSGGEICSNGTRVFVHQNIHEQFIAALKARVEKMRIGQPLDPKTQVGSLVSHDHMEKVLGYIELGKREGATLLTGGHRVTDGALAAGAFVAPTVFTNCTDDMRIMREEIFGPVMSVTTFTDEDEVVARANNTEFGLAAGIFTQNLARGHRVISRLEAGTCWINNYNITPIEMPFGGVKQSGLGRENSRLALEHYTQVKSVYVALGNVDSPY